MEKVQGKSEERYTNQVLVLLKRPTFKSLGELAQPDLRLAGLRINPKNDDASRPQYYLGVAVQELATGRSIPVTGLPEPVRLEYPQFSPHGKYFSAIEAQPGGLALWVIETATGKAMRVNAGRVAE
jgi:hypothetical protein